MRTERKIDAVGTKEKQAAWDAFALASMAENKGYDPGAEKIPRKMVDRVKEDVYCTGR